MEDYEGFLPPEVSTSGFVQLMDFIADQGRITEEECAYLKKVAEAQFKIEEQFQACAFQINAIRNVFYQDQSSLNQIQQMQKSQEKSFLVKKGEERQEERHEEAKRPATVSSGPRTLDDSTLSKEEMERKRRERYMNLQNQQEEAAKRREEEIRKANARQAFFRNEGGSSIGKF